MSDEPGRGKFVDQAAEARPSVWRRTAGWIREEILHSLGRPARLESVIASGQLIPCPIIAPVDTFWTRSVVYWQDWMSFSLSSFHSRPWTIDYRKPGYQRRLESHSLAVPEVQQLISKEKSGHLAWCALVALALARQDGGVLSSAQENLFLTRWLATALKQRRFSRDVAPDIEWLLKQGRQLGVSAKLASKLNYLWRSCTGELTEQNDLFRITCDEDRYPASKMGASWSTSSARSRW